jgi:hypothetical protein
MATFTTNPTARKTYNCATCTGTIQPGQRYARTTIPPGGTDWCSDEGWTTVITHEAADQCYYETRMAEGPE